MLKKSKCCMESKSPLYAGKCAHAGLSGAYSGCLCVVVLGLTAQELTGVPEKGPARHLQCKG